MTSVHGCEFAQNVRATGINIMHTDSWDRFVEDADALRHADPARPRVLTLGSLPAVSCGAANGTWRSQATELHEPLPADSFLAPALEVRVQTGYLHLLSCLPDCSLLTQSAPSRLVSPLPGCSFLGLNQSSFLP